VTLTGTGFGTTVAVSGSGVTPSNTRDISSTLLRVTFTVAATATPGPRNVTVATASGTSNALIFTVNAPTPGAPTLTSVAPNQGLQGTTVAVTLTGTNFVLGATTVNVSGAGVTVTNVIAGSSTSLTATFALAAAATAGARTVTVTTAGGTSGGQTFTITLPAPGQPTVSVAASGSLVAGTATTFTISAEPAAGSGATIQNVQVAFGDGTAPANLGAVSGTATTQHVYAAAGTYAVSATATDSAGGTATAAIQLVIAPVAPTLTSVAPNQGLRGTTIAVTLTGTNFVFGATTVAVAGGDVTVNTVVVGSSGSLTANFVIAPASLGGARNVTVTTAGGTSGPQTFTVTLPPPGIQSFGFVGSVDQTLYGAGRRRQHPD
jgi:hypothetical protein